MRALRVLTAAFVAVGLGLPVEAQMRPAPTAGASQMDCAALGRMPNAPMTQQACEDLMKHASAMQGAMSAGGGERPGDDAMSCEAIKAELATQQNVGVSHEHVTEGMAAGEDYIARQKRIDAEGKAVMAQQTATLAAAGALSAIPGVGAAAATAAGAANMASTQAFSAHANAELTPARRRMFEANNASMGDVAQSMQDNPRFARLAGLMQEKACR